ncbi:protein TONSOKU [Dorcoceras hygrometricum]|nr:protein TONSOKU [Dorcoceras hygrometricum]
MRLKKAAASKQLQLQAAKNAYKSALSEGNHQEEARWANVIGDILKNRGEYVEALRWLRKDYEVSLRYLPPKQLLPTCQSLGELYLRLHHYKDALVYQKKHLELANDANDLIEQQRASTQLGRTYHEMFLKSDDDHYSIRSAKKYFKFAMKLARTLKENPPSEGVSFIKEYIDAHNNLGMLELDLENLDEAEKILKRGLEICEEEEVVENDDTRSRLYHNLGNVYLELRRWQRAQEHIKKDIRICRQIGHLQGEAKGYINLGELHYRNQKYNEAISFYQKALDLAKSLEDEDALVDQIDGNIDTVREAMKVIDDLKKEEQTLKKLERYTGMSRGTDDERKCLLKQYSTIDSLVDKAKMIIAWPKVREYGKKMKQIANQLCDKEKLCNSFSVIGESYQFLRKHNKALKWFRKGWDSYRLICNLEGQVMIKINIGKTLDSSADWAGALDAFKEGYRQVSPSFCVMIAADAKLSSLQLHALQKMHYIYMIRLDDTEEARRTKLLIDELKQPTYVESDDEDSPRNHCSETKTTELDNLSTDDKSDGSFSPELSSRNFSNSVSKSTGSPTVSRKRVRVIISDDECEDDEVYCSEKIFNKGPAERTATSDEYMKRIAGSPIYEVQDVPAIVSRCTHGACPLDLETSTCSSKSRNSTVGVHDVKDIRLAGARAAIGSCNFVHNEISAANVHSCCDETCQHITCKIEDELLHVDLDLWNVGGKLSVEQLKVELACLYYLQLCRERRSKGLVPVIQHVKYKGRILDSVETLQTLRDNASGKSFVEVSVAVMVPKRVMKLYIDCCHELSVLPNLQVAKKLYNLQARITFYFLDDLVQASDDVIIVSDCELQDVSVVPLINALQLHKTFAVLDLSHNLLGNGTAEKLKQVFMSSGQSYGGLVLNLHSNQLGPSALFQICECPVLFARLEVLNLSGNCLTDSCASYLSTILKNCKALYCLDIENCSITSLTIQRLADSLDTESVLAQLFLGYNRPVSRNALSCLVLKLATLERFQELSLNGIKLSKPMVDSLCELAKECCLSGLMLGHTNIGTEGTLQLIKSLPKDTQELVRLDLSYCELTCDSIIDLCNELSLIGGILELNISGNPIKKEGGHALASFLSNPQCCLRVLAISNCQLSLLGLLHIAQALSEDCSLEELNLTENVSTQEIHALANFFEPTKATSHPPAPEKIEVRSQETCVLNIKDHQLEVADSEDDERVGTEATLPGVDDPQDTARLSENQLFQKLGASIKMAPKLQLLDLSRNGFPREVVDMLFLAWSSGARASVARRHVEEDTVHFSVQGNNCCGIKSCCRRTRAL